MKLSKLINYPLGLLGLKIIRKSRLQKVNPVDIEQDSEFMEIYEKIKPFTLVEIERCYTLYQSIQYIIQNNIAGDMVECGVWKGGSSMMMAIMLNKAAITDRNIWMYDTFEGMTKPGEKDGEFEKNEWERRKINEQTNEWCLSSFEEVRINMEQTGYPTDKFRFIKGKVEETIPANLPGTIALLRLDTDWYTSTYHELYHLFPLITSKGFLLVDDYGAWEGARKAVDEYFIGKVSPYSHRIDWTGRLFIKD